MFRWNIDIREATVLCPVGSGGIGVQLQVGINMLTWPQVALILLMIPATVPVSKWVSARGRHAII